MVVVPPSADVTINDEEPFEADFEEKHTTEMIQVPTKVSINTSKHQRVRAGRRSGSEPIQIPILNLRPFPTTEANSDPKRTRR